MVLVVWLIVAVYLNFAGLLNLLQSKCLKSAMTIRIYWDTLIRRKWCCYRRSCHFILLSIKSNYWKTSETRAVFRERKIRAYLFRALAEFATILLRVCAEGSGAATSLPPTWGPSNTLLHLPTTVRRTTKAAPTTTENNNNNTHYSSAGDCSLSALIIVTGDDFACRRLLEAGDWRTSQWDWDA